MHKDRQQNNLPWLVYITTQYNMKKNNNFIKCEWDTREKRVYGPFVQYGYNVCSKKNQIKIIIQNVNANYQIKKTITKKNNIRDYFQTNVYKILRAIALI